MQRGGGSATYNEYERGDFIAGFSQINCICFSAKKFVVMPRIRRRNAYQNVPEFYRSRFVVCKYYSLSYYSIAAHVSRYPVTVNRIWNLWIPDSQKECRKGSQRPPIPNNREDRQLNRNALRDRTTTLRILSQKMRSFARQKCRHEQFKHVCSSMNCQYGEYTSSYWPIRYLLEW